MQTVDTSRIYFGMAFNPRDRSRTRNQKFGCRQVQEQGWLIYVGHEIQFSVFREYESQFAKK